MIYEISIPDRLFCDPAGERPRLDLPPSGGEKAMVVKRARETKSVIKCAAR